MLLWKFLKIKCLRLAELDYRLPILKILLFLIIFSHKLILQLEMFSKHITPIVLNFHCQRHFDDCLNISVLGRFDRNYKPGSVLNCALKLCAFFQKDLNYEYNRILWSLYISLLSESLIEKFQTLTKY